MLKIKKISGTKGASFVKIIGTRKRFCDKYLLVSGIIGAIKRFEQWIFQIRPIENVIAKRYSYSVKVSVLENVFWHRKQRERFRSLFVKLWEFFDVS